MAAKLKIETLNSTDDKDLLNQEWLVMHNEGDTPLNAEGCSIAISTSKAPKPRVITTLKAGLIIQPKERVRIITGSAGKKSHGEPPTDNIRNFHLFLKAPYLLNSGATVRFMNRQIELCRAQTP